MTQKLLIPLSNLSKDDIEIAGGKAASLGELINAGISVPSGFVVTTEAFKLLKGKITSQFSAELLSAFDELGAERVAVRSSAVAEDSTSGSWAGQFESYLNVKRSDLIARVEDCWKSVSLGQAYATETSTGKEGLVMAVVVQKMVDSEVAGVGFSINPVTKEADEIMIEAIYGLGELLVQGMITPDNYIVSKSNFEVTDKKVQSKRTMLVFADGENVEKPVSEEKIDEPCLSDNQISELGQLINSIEKLYSTPQDVEWAIEKDKFYVVQSRPITTL